MTDSEHRLLKAVKGVARDPELEDGDPPLNEHPVHKYLEGLERTRLLLVATALAEALGALAGE